MKLSPQSRGFADSSGSPTAWLRLLPLFSWNEPPDTRLQPTRASLTRCDENTCENDVAKF